MGEDRTSVRIRRLVLRDLAVHRETAIDLARITIVRGDMGTGKTSLVDGLDLLLTGTARGTKETGAGAERYIRYGARSWTAEAILDRGDSTITVRRKRTLKGSELSVAEVVDGVSTGWDGSLPDLQTRLYAWLGASKLVVRSALALGTVGRSFADLPPDDMAAMLSGVLDISLDEESIRAAALAHPKATRAEALPDTDEGGQEAAAFDAGIDDVVTDVLRDGVPRSPEEIFRKLHAGAKAVRKATRDGVKADGAEIERIEGDASVPVDRYDEAVALLRDLRAEQAKLLEAKGATREPPNEPTEDDRAVAGKLDERAAEVTRAREEEEGLRHAFDAARDGLETSEHQRDADEAILEALRKVGSRCPVVPEGFDEGKGLPCPVEAAAVAEQVDLYERALDSSRKLVVANTEGVELGAETVSKAEAATKEAERNARAAREAAAVVDAWDTFVAEVGEEAATEGVEEKLVEVGGRIEKGEALVLSIEQEKTRRERADELRRAVRSQEPRLRAQEALCAVFGPEGIRGSLYGDAVSSFASDVSEVLDRLLDGPVSVRMVAEPKLRIETAIRRPDDGGEAWIEADRLSTGEATLVSLAVQLAANRRTGLGFVVVDNAEHLAPQRRGRLGGALLDAPPEEMRTAIVLAATDETSTIDLDDVAYVTLLPGGVADGETEEVEAEEVPEG